MGAALAEAFGAAFWVALALAATAPLPALLPPRMRTSRAHQPAPAQQA